MNHNNHETAPPVLDPVREVTLTINGKQEKISIKELPWPKALKFLQMLAANSKSFTNDDGVFEFRPDKMTDLVCNVGELSSFLILSATGKDQTWLDELSFADALEVLDAALALNLSAEVMGKAKKVASRFALGKGVNGRREAVKTESSPS